MAGPENRPEGIEKVDKNAEALQALKDALGQDPKAFEGQVGSTSAANRAQEYAQSQEQPSRFGNIDPALRGNGDLRTGGVQGMDRITQRPSAQPISQKTIAEFRASIGKGPNEPLGQGDTRALQEFNLAKLNGQKIAGLDRNGNGSFVAVDNGARVTRTGRGNTATGPGASNN